MSACLVESSGSLSVVDSALTACDFYALSPSEFSAFEAVTGVLTMTPDEILYVYAWGMGAILIPFSMAYATKMAIKVVKSI